jgi:hypothetical protein
MPTLVAARVAPGKASKFAEHGGLIELDGQMAAELRRGQDDGQGEHK